MFNWEILSLSDNHCCFVCILANVRPVVEWEKYFGSPGANGTWTGMVGQVQTQVKSTESPHSKFIESTLLLPLNLLQCVI